jgi:hypothetical protein
LKVTNIYSIENTQFTHQSVNAPTSPYPSIGRELISGDLITCQPCVDKYLLSIYRNSDQIDRGQNPNPPIVVFTLVRKKCQRGEKRMADKVHLLTWWLYHEASPISIITDDRKAISRDRLNEAKFRRYERERGGRGGKAKL